MGIKKYFDRKNAEKELGQGFYQDNGTNYKHYVKDIIRALQSYYNISLEKEQVAISDIVKECRQAKTDIQTAMFGKYLSLMLTGMTVASLSESELNYVFAGLFGASTILMQVFQMKSNRELKREKNKLKEKFGVDRLTEGVYAKRTSTDLILPLGSYISDKTCKTCIDDACDSIIERGFSR